MGLVDPENGLLGSSPMLDDWERPPGIGLLEEESWSIPADDPAFIDVCRSDAASYVTQKA